MVMVLKGMEPFDIMRKLDQSSHPVCLLSSLDYREVRQLVNTSYKEKAQSDTKWSPGFGAAWTRRSCLRAA